MFLKIDEFAAEFRVSRRAMEGLLQKHPVGFRVGNRWQFDQSDMARLREALEAVDPRLSRLRAKPVIDTSPPGAALARARGLLKQRKTR